MRLAVILCYEGCQGSVFSKTARFQLNSRKKTFREESVPLRMMTDIESKGHRGRI